MNTNRLAKQYQLREWAEMISNCRTSGLKIDDWCAKNGITNSNYYYRLRRVREACLENEHSEIVPVPKPVIINDLPNKDNGYLDITINSITIHVTENTPMTLLNSVLQVISHA